MSKNSKLLLIYLSVGVSLTACMGGGGSNSSNFSNSSSSSTATFASQLAQIKVSDPNLVAFQSNFINYYSKVSVSKTITTANYTIDCVPFNQQPSLINLSQTELKSVYKPSKVVSSSFLPSISGTLQQLTRVFDLPHTSCPSDTVAILRPLLRNFSSDNLRAFNKYPSTISDDLSAYHWVDAAYNNNDSYTLSDESLTSTSVKFSGDFNPTMTMPVLDGSHVINQSWWTSEAGSGSPYFMSLETGLIKSAYFTLTPQITIFAFSTVNNYGNGPAGGCYNLECSAFIQYPDTPALGEPVNLTGFDVILQYKIIPEGYELDLTLTDESGSAEIPIGYYPYSRYSTNDPQTDNPFRYFSAGAEIEAGNLIDQFQINGTLYYLAYNDTNYLPVNGYVLPNPNPPYYGANVVYNPSIDNYLLNFFTN